MNPQTKEEVAERIRDIVAEKSERPRTEVLPSSVLGADLGFDSLDGVELIMAVEKEYNIAIPDERAEKATNFQSLVDTAWEYIPQAQKK